MLGCKDRIGYTKEGVGSCGINGDLNFSSFDKKVDFGAFAFPDPIPLHLLEGVRPLEEIKVLQESFRIGGNLQHPLTHGAPFHRMAASFGARSLCGIKYFLIGQNRAKGRAVPNRRFRDVGEAFFVKLKKNPLGPAEVLWIGGIDLAGPVITKTHRFDLPPEVADIFCCGDARVGTRLDSVLFRWKAESVPTHGVKNIVSLHAAVPRKNVGRSVPLEMTYV